MAGFIRVPADSTGKRVDTVTLTDATVEVHRQKMVVAGGSGTAEVVVVTNAAPAAGDMGMVVRHAGTATVTGVVALTAGSAVIGDINAISRTVQVAVATPFTLNNISATVSVQGNVNISATATVVGTLNVAGQVSIAGAVSPYIAASVASASRGPRCVLVSTSANATLIAAPGAGMAIYVTSLAVSNASGSNTRSRVGTSASTGQVTMMLAASGGGFVMPFAPSWKLSTNEALLGSIKPNASEAIFNINYYVASADAV